MAVANQIDFKTLSTCKDFRMAFMSRIGNIVSRYTEVRLIFDSYLEHIYICSIYISKSKNKRSKNSRSSNKVPQKYFCFRLQLI